MVSLRTLFLAVYASNRVIRALFLPLWYITLFSPFALAIAWYFGFDQTVRQFIPENFSWFDLLPQFAVSAVFVLLPTRLLSSSSKALTSKNGTRRVQPLPYWIPGLQHFWSIAFGGQEWLSDIRDSSITSIVAYNAAGTKHNVLLSELLLDQVYKNRQNLEVPDNNQSALLRNAFNLPKAMESHYIELRQEITQTIQTELHTGATRENLIKLSLNILADSLPDLTTFNSSIVDQMPWERVSNVDLTDGTSEAECDLFILINEFCCNAILPPIMGSQFTESYQLLATNLATFNERYWALALGLPRLSPIQGLPGAALAKKNLVNTFAKMFNDLTNPPTKRVPDDDESVSGDEDTDADTITPIMKLNELFTKHDLPMRLRASIALHLVHNMVSEVVPLVFWALLHIYSASQAQDAQSSEPTPLERIRQESKSLAQAVQPPSIHPSFPAPPEIRFGSSAQTLSPSTLPYLRSCINEARRLYSCSVDTYKVNQSFALKEEDIAGKGQEEQWELEADSCIDVGLSRCIINSSPAVYPSPQTFKPDRFIDTPTPTSIVSPTDEAEHYRTSLLLSLIAGIIQLWEIAPAPKKSFFEHIQEAGNEASIGAAALTGEQKAAREESNRKKQEGKRKDAKWVFPKAVEGASVKVPKGDIRVRIRRREGLPTSKIPVKLSEQGVHRTFRTDTGTDTGNREFVQEKLGGRWSCYVCKET
ncbi:cytochrome p450 [Pyrenophora seminiperda CCB06]|uniref:Cytochrome p450 n=1 Tax=Pyrenophora seminiperda CCB06 TaxID=1302712 RepID=A0A3M7MFG8_9PLEO|nr:cytochrome p450 [Pyrenophora seminiperda CCB06]